MHRPVHRETVAGRLARRTPATPAGRGTGRISRALESQQAAIEALTRQLSALQGNQQPVSLQIPGPGRAPVAAAPDKCKLDMSMSEFRSWRRSVEYWLQLNNWNGREAVMHLRLWCEAELQSALDAKLSSAEVLAMTPTTMLDVLQDLVTSSSNQAVLWDVFFSSHQSVEESMKVYFNKCLQAAIDCKFKCPSCASDLAEYILVRKIMVGLHNPMLKRELYQSASESMTLDELKMKCVAFEAAARDSLGGKPNVFGAAVELSDEEEPPAAEGIMAAGMGRQRRGPAKEGPKCLNCDKYHDQGRQYCPARNVECFKCGGKGHFARCCMKSKRKIQGGKNSLATVRVSGTGASNLPKVRIEMCVASKGKWYEAMAVADTGAEVCVAGTQHLRLWGLNKKQLRKPKVRLVDIVGKAVPVWGVAVCGIRIGSVECQQKVYFAKSSSCVFLSLDSCKELCLVPKNFPYAQVPGDGCVTMALSAPSTDGPLTVGSLAQSCGDVRGRCDVRGGAKRESCVSDSVPGVLAPPTSETRLSAPSDAVTSEGRGGATAPLCGAARVPTVLAPPINRGRPPFPLVETNVERLQEWLLQRFSATTFNTKLCPLPVMTGPPHHIHIIPDAKPVAFHTPLTVANHWEDEVKKQLDNDELQGIIRKVPAGEATEWCSRMVVTPKKNGQPRRTVDFQPLNAACNRETHHTAAPFDMVSNIPPHTFKTVADAYSGYHQVKLDEESQRLTTFITQWGRYQYLRTPMGHCAAPDAYTKRFDDVIVSVDRKYKCIDDTLLYDSSVDQAFWHVYDFLELCEKHGITLNPSKFKFCKREVEFVGYHVGWEAYHPTEDRLSAVKNFPMPPEPSITDIRAWYGLVNQLAPFLATAPVMAPFRDLLKKPVKKKVYWDEQLQREFEKAKDTICQLAKEGLMYYDKSRPTAAVTDWCRNGIGFVVMQQYCSCVTLDAPFCCKGGWKLVLCGSRHLTSAEAGYAAIEGEALAVVWCLKKARLFLLGCPNLTIVTDHRPLVKTFGDKEMKNIENPRLFRLKEKTLQYHFNIKYLPGKKNCAADTLSRYPSLRANPDKDDVDLSDDIMVAMVTSLTAALEIDDVIVMDQETVKSAAQEDLAYQSLLTRVSNGDWARSKNQEIECLKPFYGVRERLAVTDGLITYTYDQGCVRLVIPECLRQQVTANLHSGHQGLDSMLRRARQSVYWPGITGDLEYERAKCQVCDTHTPSQQQEPLIMTPPPDYPFQQVVADLFQINGRTYLAFADRLTGWVEVAHLHNGATSGHLINILRRLFVRWGAPEELSTDGGTNLSSEEMRSFLKKWGVASRISSAFFPQSNGRAEAGVKVAKRAIGDHLGPGGSLETDGVAKALLQYHNTPLHGEKVSPAQLATGRCLRDSVPSAHQHYKVNRQWKKSLRSRELKMAEKSRRVCEKTDGKTKNLKPLQMGQHVRVQDPVSGKWDRSGTVIEGRGYRQYRIRLEGSGRVSLRNRRHLRVTLSPPSTGGEETARMGESLDPPRQQLGGELPPLVEQESVPDPRQRRCRRPPGWHNDYEM